MLAGATVAKKFVQVCDRPTWGKVQQRLEDSGGAFALAMHSPWMPARPDDVLVVVVVAVEDEGRSSARGAGETGSAAVHAGATRSTLSHSRPPPLQLYTHR